MKGQTLWDEISYYTKDIKVFADKGDFNSAIILCDDLKNFLKSEAKQ